MSGLENFFYAWCDDTRPPLPVIEEGLKDGNRFYNLYGDEVRRYLDKLESVKLAYMIRYYDDDDEWVEHCKYIDSLSDKDTIELANCELVDDCMILGTSGNSYYWFWLHLSGAMDVGRCSLDRPDDIGKSIETEMFNEAVDIVEYAMDFDKENEDIKDFIKEIPVESFYKDSKLKKIVI